MYSFDSPARLHAFLFTLLFSFAAMLHAEPESLAPLPGNSPPKSFEELWAGYDPRHEPLEIQVLKAWEEDGVVLRVLRYRIGVFKGQKAWMAAVYGCPKGGQNLPGLVQIHGGGQYADYRAPLYNAKRGYATISLAWAGRIAAPGYSVNPEGVQLFWDQKTDHPKYLVTTDWGKVDGYHAPRRSEHADFSSTKPNAWTLDPVDSPRNTGWFLCALAARRALTFLEQQPEVDRQKLGVYGHSMGGKLTVLTAAADPRVRAAAPSCGGVSDRYVNAANPLYCATIDDGVNLRHVTCPIIFLSPANDFHGRIDDLQRALGEIRSTDWRITCSPHHNHQDTAEYECATPLWFDQQLRGRFQFPRTPEAALVLATGTGNPRFRLTPDRSRKIVGVDIFYTQHGQPEGQKDDRLNTRNRYWHHAVATSDGQTWTAELPLGDLTRQVWAYGNVIYALDEPATGAGYYYRGYSSEICNLSTRLQVASPAQLQAAGLKATLAPSRLIESFDPGWEKAWFSYDPTTWERRTHKLYDARWAAPAGANLVLEVRASERNTLVVGLDDYAASVALSGGAGWQRVALAPSDFRNATGEPLASWKGVCELRLTPRETLKLRVKGQETSRVMGSEWRGARPEFRTLRWDDTAPKT